jgi:hypothetical protein
MQTLLEIIGSTIIGGMLLLLILTAKTNVSRSSDSQVVNANIQSNLTAITEIIEADLKNLGYRITDSTFFSSADSNKISFKFFNDSTNTVDSIAYYYLADEGNLYRKYNNNPPGKIRLGTTAFKVWYYDKFGNITYSMPAIKSFKIAISLQDTFKYDGDPVVAYWEKTFKPQNL